MRGIWGTYCVGSTVTHRTDLRLVSIQDARNRAIALHGSEAAMQTFVEAQHALRLADYRRKTTSRLSSSSRCRRPTSPSVFLNDPKDQFCGMASTPFPSLKMSAEAEHGLWCLGCHDMFDHWSGFKMLEGANDASEDEGARTQRLWSGECRAWSKSGFLAHIKGCQGALSKFKEINGL